ncbi:hypothetical protein RHGRI_027739 [Rhododendron griersonianum]|uniref:Phytocyanin domain-containing protein n=1 Tax=Rhododendron griersonianum TaxID=479676 RepID=A0AAV6J2A3_9ERIC|nr:hypothetical protein RHGRI_027739 [Rhododendron griersonianum]
MAKQFQVCVLLVILGLALTCRATLYNVGDSSGWDVSSDLDTWKQGKTFVVGDVLVFQYSSSNSVSEVTKQSYQTCNTTNGILQSGSNGNSSFPLTSPGDWYFISGNNLYCLGGMKLHVTVENNPAAAPAPAPESAGTSVSTSTPSSKTNTVISSSVPVFVRGGVDSLVLALMGLVASSILCFG